MTQNGDVWRSRWALMFCASLLLALGCSSTQAAYSGTGASGLEGGTAGRGDAIAQAAAAQCGPTDSTVSCCLKQHPGDYERCGAVAPTQAPTRTPKQAPQIDPEPLPPPTSAAPPNRRKREEQCREYYLQCMALGGEYEKRGQYGRSICQSCYDTCNANGSWPAKVNEFECLGSN